MADFDIIIENNDVIIENGDFAIREATQQNFMHIIIADGGNYKTAQTVGVGIYKFQNAPVTDGRVFNKTIKTQLKADGYQNINIYGQYEESTNETQLKVEGVRVNAAPRQTLDSDGTYTSPEYDYVREGQTLYDFCVWKYGTIQEIKRLMTDNNLTLSGGVITGQRLLYYKDAGNEDVKSYYRINKIIPTSGVTNIRDDNNYIFEDDNSFIFEDGNNYIFE